MNYPVKPVLARFRSFMSQSRSALVPVLSLGTVAAGNASAQAAGGFDPGSILGAIAAMLAAGILIWTAWAAARWTLKAFGIVTK